MLYDYITAFSYRICKCVLSVIVICVLSVIDMIVMFLGPALWHSPLLYKTVGQRGPGREGTSRESGTLLDIFMTEPKIRA